MSGERTELVSSVICTTNQIWRNPWAGVRNNGIIRPAYKFEDTHILSLEESEASSRRSAFAPPSYLGTDDCAERPYIAWLYSETSVASMRTSVSVKQRAAVAKEYGVRDGESTLV